MSTQDQSLSDLSLEALESLVQKDPGSPAFSELANRLCDAKRGEKALEICKQGLAENPGDLAGRRALGRALLLTGRLQEAQTELLGIIKVKRDDAAAMLLLTDVLLQKADPGRAKAMLQHATKLLGKTDAGVERLWAALGGMTGEIDIPTSTERRAAAKQALTPKPDLKKPKAAEPVGPLIGGQGAIINVEDADEGLQLGPVEEDPDRYAPAAALAGKVTWIAALSLLVVVGGVTSWRMRSRTNAVSGAVNTSRKALRSGSLARYRAARRAVKAALKKDTNNPDLLAWLAKIEARMALEYMVKIKRVPAAIFAAEKVQSKLRRNPPGALRRLQVRLGLAYRSPSWGAESLLEAQAIQQLLTGIKPRKGARGVRDHTVQLLDRGIKKYPKARGLRYVRGLAHLANGNPTQAEKDLEATVAADKDHVPAQLALAEVYLEQGRVVEAQERFNRVLGVNPRSLRARLGMIQSRLLRNRELGLVASELKKLTPTAKSPRLIRAWYRLARAWLLWAEGKPSHASRALEHASQSLIPEARWLSWYIRLCLMLGEVDHARRPLVHGLVALRAGDDPSVLAFRLEVRLNQGLPKPVIADAHKLLKRVGRRGPAARRALLVLARAHLAAGRTSAATQALGALAKLKPEPADAQAATLYGHLATGLGALARLRSHGSKSKKKGGAKATPSGSARAELKRARDGLRKLLQGGSAPAARYALARLTPQPDKARELLTRGVAHHRDAAAAGVLYARLLIGADKLADARRQLEAAMERAPAYYPAVRTRALLRLRTGHLTEALNDTTTLCYAGYSTRLPRGALERVAYTARWASRLSRLDRRAVCPSELIGAQDLLARAAIFVAMEQPDSLDPALLLLAMAARSGADAGRVGVLRARALLSGQQTPERGKQAEALLKALAKERSSIASRANFQYARGQALYAQNDTKGAFKAFRQALAVRPSHLPTLRSLGWLLLSAKQVGPAVKIFKKAVALAKRWEACPFRVRSRLQFALGQALITKGKHRDLKGAGAAFTEAIRLNGQLYQAAVSLARVHLATGRTKEARRQLGEVLDASPDNPDALLMSARLDWASPKTRPAAEELITRLLRRIAQDIRNGRAGEARFWLEEVLRKVSKTHPLTSLVLGRLLERTPGEKARARKLLKAAKGVKPPTWLAPLLKKLQSK